MCAKIVVIVVIVVIVLIAAITDGTYLDETAEVMFRMKCTRHRCHDAPVNR